jgi:hypothetical protein
LRRLPVEKKQQTSAGSVFAPGGMPEAKVADLVQTLRQDVLEEAAHELLARDAGDPPAIGFAMLVADGDSLVAVNGIYGNSKQEAMYPIYAIDSDGQKLDGTTRYAVRFAPGDLPPVNAFWSLTMYELPSSLLVANPINRYLLNSPMIPQFKRDADGSITFYIQNESPGADKEANWLPAPKGPFVCFMRLYWPKPEALDGRWKQPPMQKVS